MPAARQGSQFKFTVLTLLIFLAVLILSNVQAFAAPACCEQSEPTAGTAGNTTLHLTGAPQTVADIATLLSPSAEPGQFHSLPANYTSHWWRNFRNPEYCRMVLCLGSCAYRGEAGSSACSLQPLFPLLNGSKLLLNPGCDM